jgi:peptide/nickel transport system ATP-binding protein
MSAAPLLQVEDLSLSFRGANGMLPILRGISFSLQAGETLCLVGESGCGKSVTALSILRLLPRATTRIDGGRILFEGQDLLHLDDAAMRALRGNRISMIFQEPMTSLNPVLTIGRQIGEVLQLHRGLDAAAAKEEARRLLDRVRIPDAKRRLGDYPHHLSGGMRQRVMIAIALACRPRLLIADEPTTALDVTIQSQILTLLQELKQETGTAILLITHDLGVVAEMADKVTVLYAGATAEAARVKDLFALPRHPYTRGLMGSMPRFARAVQGDRRQARLAEIPGVVPAPHARPPGCAFADRCAQATDRCAAEPPLAELAPGHTVACWHPFGAEARDVA